ncbi:MAG TPA: pilus assembly protein TadG-related protein [Micropepsaceae bacterium]
MIFALSSLTLFSAAGAGIDMSRAMNAKSRLAGALDAAALAVGTTNGLTTPQLQTLAQKYFDANYPATALGTHTPVTVAVNGQSITLGVTGRVPTTLLQVAGIGDVDLSVTNQVTKAVTKLRVALVLDNTGSMSQTDNTGTSKISALKTATHQLLTQLQGAAVNPGDVQVSIVPFSLDVNYGTSNPAATWIDWTDFDAQSRQPSYSVGPGSTCPYTNGTDGFKCAKSPVNDPNCNVGSNNTCVSTVPSSGTYKGYICPSAHQTDASNGRGGHFYNGCWDSVLVSGRYTHTWHGNTHTTWTGCFMDRAQNYDTNNSTPVVATPATLFPAENNLYCPPVALNALSYDWASLGSKVDAMTPNGSTNQTIGLAWGFQALTSTNPLNAPAQDPTIQNVIVLLSDGLNTQNRFAGDGSNQSSAVDARMALACTNAKAAGVRIYTVLVMSGNSSILQNCATDSKKYFSLNTAGQIVTAFNTIGTELANLHLSR